jgi:RNA recognition motif-containing protein
LYVGGIDERVTEEALRDHFYAFGKLKSVRVMHAKKCAFVTFDERQGAEAAAAAGHEAHVAGLRCRVMWGKPSAAKRKNAPGGPQQAPAGSAQQAHQQASNPGAVRPGFHAFAVRAARVHRRARRVPVHGPKSARVARRGERVSARGAAVWCYV